MAKKRKAAKKKAAKGTKKKVRRKKKAAGAKGTKKKGRRKKAKRKTKKAYQHAVAFATPVAGRVSTLTRRRFPCGSAAALNRRERAVR